MRWQSLGILAACISVLGCGAKPEPLPPSTEAPAVSPPPAKAIDVRKLTFNVPKGWVIEPSEHFESVVLRGGFAAGHTARVTVEPIPPGQPKSLTEFLALGQEKKLLGRGYLWFETIESGPLDDGFFLIGKTATVFDVDKPPAKAESTGVVVVRTLGGTPVLFRCEWNLTVDWAKQIIQICKSARLP